MPEALVFSRLHLPRPITPATVSTLLTRMSASDVPRPIAFELRADDSGLVHIVAAHATAIQKVKSLLLAAVPATVFSKADRTPLPVAGRVVATRTALPTSRYDDEALSAALFTAVDQRQPGEVVAIQVVLGRSHGPQPVAADALDPLQPLASQLWQGSRPAASDIRRRLTEAATATRIAVTLRVGVQAADSTRRAALVHAVFGSLQSLENVGVRLRLRREPAVRFLEAALGRPGLMLTPAALTPLIGWPLGEQNLPGVDPVHPKRLAADKTVSAREAVFALSTAPGPERPIGFDATGRLQHIVVIGPTGSGKSLVLEHLVLSDIAAGRATVVVEPKRQLVDAILSHAPASAAGQIVLLDAADPHPVGFNPLDIGDRDPDVAMDGVLAALAAVFEDGWGPRTEYLIQGALLTLARAGTERGVPYTLIDLPTLLTEAGFRRSVTKYVTNDVTLAAFWAEFEDASPGQRAAMIAAPLNKLRKLVLRKNLTAVLGQPRPRFRLRDAFRDGKTVLVPLNDALIGVGASKLLGSLIVAELWQATLERASEKDPTKRPGMVFVDEVQNYLHLPTSIGDALATSRSYGVAWHLAHQYRGQLPKAMRDALDTNARSKIAFALGPDDARDMARQALDLTADDFQQLGQYEIYAHLMHGGRSAGWLSARTLEPPPVVGAGEAIRKASREQFAGSQPPQDVPDTDASPPTTEETKKPSRPRGQKARRA